MLPVELDRGHYRNWPEAQTTLKLDSRSLSMEGGPAIDFLGCNRQCNAEENLTTRQVNVRSKNEE
jgi:hypothetical protein